jgi:acetylornithine/succinyldiaminopimelate/putrescine aminotransferase
VHTQVGEQNTAAVIIEPIQGEAGFIVPPAGGGRPLAEVTGRADVMDSVHGCGLGGT